MNVRISVEVHVWVSVCVHACACLCICDILSIILKLQDELKEKIHFPDSCKCALEFRMLLIRLEFTVTCHSNGFVIMSIMRASVVE